MKRFTFVWVGAILLSSGLLLGLSLGTYLSDDSAYKSLKKLEDAFLVITQRYVEDVDSSELAERAIEGMLERLDPHSIYIDAERMAKVNEDFDASFEGIGISYELIPGPNSKDTLAVLNPLPGGPSEEVGLLSGDRIIAVDGNSAIGYTHEDVQQNLKGPRGTEVGVTVKRPGYGRELKFNITRDKIPINTLEAAYMLDGQTGFIKLNRFARTTHSEFRDAVTALTSQGMQRMILDLRGNAGGFMHRAVRVTDEILDAGKTIVTARGRFPDTNEEYTSKPGGLFEDKPVIVLVDENSASASEIVAGALQDHDRALILGRRTFGKGTVQKQYVLNDGSALRVTISRYYTPSGRLIQTPYEEGDREGYYMSKIEQRQEDRTLDLQEILSSIPDSLKYQTDGGRVVIGGGGILPDVIVQADSLSPLMRVVLGKNLESPFVRGWIDRQGADFREMWAKDLTEFVDQFELSDKDLEEFLAYAEEKGLSIVAGEQRTESIQEGESYEFTAADLEADKELLKSRLKGRIAWRLYDRSAWYPVSRSFDKILSETGSLWERAESLAFADVSRATISR